MESDLPTGMVIRPTIFRRHIFGTIFSYILLFGGIGGVIFGLFTGAIAPPGLIFVIIGALGALVGLFFILKWWLISRTTTLTLCEDRIQFKEGIIRQSTSEVRHDDVRNIKIDQNIKERLLNFGDIAISSAGQADMEIVIDDIPNPEKVAAFIRARQV